MIDGICPSCGKKMKGFWCDDGQHIPGTLYECTCGKEYADTPEEGLVEVTE